MHVFLFFSLRGRYHTQILQHFLKIISKLIKREYLFSMHLTPLSSKNTAKALWIKYTLFHNIEINSKNINQKKSYKRNL